MILGFKKQFTDKILSGEKIHTIREDKKNRWEKGNIIHFANDIRTKNYNCFKIGECISTQKVKIIHHRGRGGSKYNLTIDVIVDGSYISEDEIIKLSKNDGFYLFSGFLDLFNKDFEGKIIHWTNFKY